MLEPFAKKTGAEFAIKYGGADEWLNNSLINSACAGDRPADALSAGRGTRNQDSDLFIDLNATNVPNIKDIHPVFYDTYEGRAVGFNYTDYGFIYNTTKVNPGPTVVGRLVGPALQGTASVSGSHGGRDVRDDPRRCEAQWRQRR